MKYLTKTLGLHHFLNVSNSTRTINKKSAELERNAYMRDYQGAFAFTVTESPIDAETLTSAEALLSYTRVVAEDLRQHDRHLHLFVHAESGLMDEAYVAIVLWRLLYPEEAPSDVSQWIQEHNKQALFDDDDDKRSVLVACWKLLDAERDKQRKIRMFGLPQKKAKK